MDQQMKPKPPANSSRPKLPDPLTELDASQEFARLNVFLSNGFFASKGPTGTYYKVTLAQGVSRENLFAFLKSTAIHIPCSVIGVAGKEILKMFIDAERVGLVSLNVSHTSEVPPGRYK